jgi:predicted phage terminase large subunit-like protein
MLEYKHWDTVHIDVAAFLKKPARKKALLMPRGHLKTSIVTVGFTIQAILKNPNVRVLIANQIWDKSRDMLSEIKGHLERSQLKYLFGEFMSARWNADEIIVKQRTKSLKEPTIATTGVEAETTGGHYDLIILDDLTGLQNSQTPEQRDKTKRFRRSMINLLEPGGLLLEVGTRWHLDDTFSEIFEKEARYYDIMVRKIVEGGKLIFPGKFAKKFDPFRKDWAEVADPTCMDYVDHLKASMPLDEFSAQYLNEPFSSENQLFKPEMFQYWNKKPEGLYVGMAVDLAISEQRQADYTAIVVCGMDKDWKLYVLDYLRGHWKPGEIVGNVFDMHNRWKPYATGMEVNGFQRTLKLACEEEMRKRHQYFGIEEIRTGPEKSKESRIKSLEPFYRGMNVFHAAWMKGKEMEVELQTFPKGKNDDLIDAVSMCLPLLSPGIAPERQDMTPGTYEWVEREAHRYNGRYTNYLNF